VYERFLDVMVQFKGNAISTSDVIQRVLTLFKGQTALILGFNQFLPQGYSIAVLADNEFSVTVPNQRPLQRRSYQQPRTTTAQPSMHTASNETEVNNSHSLIFPQQSSCPASLPNFSLGKENTLPRSVKRKRVSAQLLQCTPSTPSTGVCHFLEQIKSASRNRPAMYSTFLNIMKEFGEDKINAEAVVDSVMSLFEGNDDLIVGFNQYLLDGIQAAETQLQNTSPGLSTQPSPVQSSEYFSSPFSHHHLATHKSPPLLTQLKI
jgi:histone deacetylase complex regulatory component SIN3